VEVAKATSTADPASGRASALPAGIKAEVAGQSWAKDVTVPTCSVAGQSVDTGSEARCFAQYMRILSLFSPVVGIALVLAGIGFAILALGGTRRRDAA
jgi:hypothetical protein